MFFASDAGNVSIGLLPSTFPVFLAFRNIYSGKVVEFRRECRIAPGREVGPPIQSPLFSPPEPAAHGTITARFFSEIRKNMTFTLNFSDFILRPYNDLAAVFVCL